MKKVIYLLLIGGQYLFALTKVKLNRIIWHVALIIIIKAFHQIARLQPVLCALTLQLM